MESLSRYRLVIAGVALVAMVGLTWWAVDANTGETPEDPAQTPRLPTIRRNRITEVEIRRPGDDAAIRLAKRGNTWRVVAPVDAPATQTAVTAALDKLVDLEVTGVATTRTKHHERLEVDREHAIRVTARAGSSELIDFWIGSFGDGTTAVRLDGENRVLMIEGSIKPAFDKPLRAWRDQTIVSASPTTMREVTFVNTNGTFHFRKGASAWEEVLPETAGARPRPPRRAPAGIERFSAAKVQSTVGSLSRLTAADFAAPNVTREQAGLGANAATVTLISGEGQSAQTIRLTVGNEVSEGQRYLMREGNPTIFIVSRFNATALVPNTAAFQEAEHPPEGEGDEEEAPGAHPPMPPGGMQGIPPEMLQQLLQQRAQQQGTN